MLGKIEEKIDSLKRIQKDIEDGASVRACDWEMIVRDAIEAMEALQEGETIPGERLAQDIAFRLMCSDDYKLRAKGEYLFVKDKYEKLHRMIIKREAGKLDFAPNCPMEQWKAQAAAMGQYLYQLEIKAEIEGVEL